MIYFENVTKNYPSSHGGIYNLNLEVEQGEFVYIIGESGAGKSTIINLLMKNIDPDGGKIRLSHIDLASIPKEDLPVFRRNFGIIAQSVGMMMSQTVFQNVALPMVVRGEKAHIVKSTVDVMLGSVGIRDIAQKKAKHISGGELARVAIARALITNPPIILADEPTAGLDNEISWDIMNLLEHFNHNGTTILMATHQKSLVNLTRKRVITLKDGRILSDRRAGRYASR
ncbi:MAG: ATP-binding cassette domain-containing protein [Peptostreptococcaceae bacterium]|nr:ATP-binding cassette domain-containing protein [Peptostreptococcaceae bacterium]